MCVAWKSLSLKLTSKKLLLPKVVSLKCKVSINLIEDNKIIVRFCVYSLSSYFIPFKFLCIVAMQFKAPEYWSTSCEFVSCTMTDQDLSYSRHTQRGRVLQNLQVVAMLRVMHVNIFCLFCEILYCFRKMMTKSFTFICIVLGTMILEMLQQ